jgi:hypothetical protein
MQYKFTEQLQGVRLPFTLRHAIHLNRTLQTSIMTIGHAKNDHFRRREDDYRRYGDFGASRMISEERRMMTLSRVVGQ